VRIQKRYLAGEAFVVGHVIAVHARNVFSLRCVQALVEHVPHANARSVADHADSRVRLRCTMEDCAGLVSRTIVDYDQFVFGKRLRRKAAE
jgi:hypothetical protein